MISWIYSRNPVIDTASKNIHNPECTLTPLCFLPQKNMREEERRRREREKESRSPSGLKREQREPIMIPPHPLTFSQNQKTDYPRLLIFDEREDPFSRRNEKRRNVVVVVCRVKCAPSVVGVRVATSSPSFPQVVVVSPGTVRATAKRRKALGRPRYQPSWRCFSR